MGLENLEDAAETVVLEKQCSIHTECVCGGMGGGEGENAKEFSKKF